MIHPVSSFMEGDFMNLRIQKWDTHNFNNCENRTYGDFGNFTADARADIEDMLKEYPELSIKVFATGYFYISGFISIEGTEKCVYFCTKDVRPEESNDWDQNVLVREAENYRDYRGGTNMFVPFDCIGKEAHKIGRRIMQKDEKCKA